VQQRQRGWHTGQNWLAGSEIPILAESIFSTEFQQKGTFRITKKAAAFRWFTHLRAPAKGWRAGFIKASTTWRTSIWLGRGQNNHGVSMMSSRRRPTPGTRPCGGILDDLLFKCAFFVSADRTCGQKGRRFKELAGQLVWRCSYWGTSSDTARMQSCPSKRTLSAEYAVSLSSPDFMRSLVITFRTGPFWS